MTKKLKLDRQILSVAVAVIVGTGWASAQESAPNAGAAPSAVQEPDATPPAAPGNAGAPPTANNNSGATANPAEGGTASAAPVSYLPPQARVSQSEIDALLAAPEGALMPFTAGYNLQNRVMMLAGSDLRAVSTLVQYAGTAPNGVVRDIATGLARASRDAESTGSVAYGQRIQEIVGGANLPPLVEAYAQAERNYNSVPQTAALGGGGGGGGFSAGSLTGASNGLGPAGPFGGDRTVATTMGSYPIFGGSRSFALDDDNNDDDDDNDGDAGVVPSPLDPTDPDDDNDVSPAS